MANVLGDTETAEEFWRRSKFFKNVWSDEHKFFCPRYINGTFDCPFININPFDKRYTEGSY